jgi:hypothetical protein
MVFYSGFNFNTPPRKGTRKVTGFLAKKRGRDDSRPLCSSNKKAAGSCGGPHGSCAVIAYDQLWTDSSDMFCHHQLSVEILVAILLIILRRIFDGPFYRYLIYLSIPILISIELSRPVSADFLNRFKVYLIIFRSKSV